FRWVGSVGNYFDSETGLYYIRARTYQPTIARWTSVDPLFYMLARAGVNGLGPNERNESWSSHSSLYEYVRSHRLILVDTSGKDACSCDCDGELMINEY